MSTATRRGFLAGALASAAAPALARADAPTPPPGFQARQEIVRRGRAIAVSPGGRVVVSAHAARRTVEVIARGRSRLVDVGGQPVEVAVSPDGRRAAVTTASWDEPGLALVDLRSAALLSRLAVGPAPHGVAFSPDGSRLVVVGGEQQGTVHVLDAATLATVAERSVGLVPRGLAVGERRAWIALNGLDRVVGVDLEKGRIRRSLRVPALPDRIALSADGRRLLVSHGGIDSEHVTEVEVSTRRLKRHRAGRQPSGVAWTRRGRALVALGGAAELVLLSGRRRRRIEVAAAPRGLAAAAGRAWTVSALTGAVSEVRA